MKISLDLSMSYDFTVAITCFRKRDEHLLSSASGPRDKQLDFFSLVWMKIVYMQRLWSYASWEFNLTK